ncbi:hypothetical protein H8S37_04660 [Mediterraneibacter sp. NSJ-55]|uniref:Uncharacterized protein n=1 Tax=Mediterraneibacter hominis TaxID=2763054 RepID=A0A923LH74_9FIRM|nr:hypothetical protein [Mediterraneibacter hominis]MBC5688220.1 hypothetical protein [Mediterraneibacter hominis]
MAGRRKKVSEKDYDALIKSSEGKIAKLVEDTKAERLVLRQLKKDKAKYEAQKAAKAAEKEKEELVEMIVKSGKTIDEIKELLLK